MLHTLREALGDMVILATFRTKQEGGEKDVEEDRQRLLRHHRESAQADNRRRGHQGELCRGDIFTFCHDVELCFTTGRQSVSVPQRGRADVFSGVCMVYAGVCVSLHAS